MGIWEARRKFDESRRNMTLGTAIGGIAGTSTVAGLTLAGVIVTSTPVIVPILVGAIVTYAATRFSYAFSEKVFEKNLLNEVNSCIDTFNSEVESAKIEVKKQISGFITQLFENELKSMERNFLQFRSSAYLEEDKLPKLKSQIEYLEKGIQNITKEEVEFI